MKIPGALKKRLLTELGFVAKKVKDEDDITRKLYFMSAAHGAIERAMRFHPDNELLIAHFILNMCYSVLLDRFNRIKAGDKTIQLPDDWHQQIADCLSHLGDLISKDQPVYPALEKVMQLAYSVTGPGYYALSYLKSLAR